MVVYYQCTLCVQVSVSVFTQLLMPGHARKEGRHVAKMGASRGFSLSVAPVFGFSRGMTGQEVAECFLPSVARVKGRPSARKRRCSDDECELL